jgi:hypothetical protein
MRNLKTQQLSSTRRASQILYNMQSLYFIDSIWIGKGYEDSRNNLRGALILGESTYGEVPAEDPQWIWYFINKEAGDNRKYIDRTFGRLYRFMSPSPWASAATWPLRVTLNIFKVSKGEKKRLGRSRKRKQKNY